MSSIVNIANQLFYFGQLYEGFTPATAADLRAMSSEEVQQYAANLPGTGTMTDALRTSLRTLAKEKETTPEISK